MELRERIFKVLERAGCETIEDSHEGYHADCPLPSHDDSTPSFTINVETGLWICFGCDQAGNLPILVSRVFDVPMSEAMRDWLIEDDTWHELPERTDNNRYKEMPETVLAAYGSCPVYMLERGFPKKLLKQFGIGYDSIENRVVFPIRDLNGKLVGLTKRATFPDVWPKYKHTKFEKSLHLYLGNHVKQRLGVTPLGCKQGIVFVVEGHVDALRLWQLLAGKWMRGERKGLNYTQYEFIGAVASMGGGLSKEQARNLALLDIQHVVLAYDHDEAGEKYEKKTFEALLDAGIRNVYRLGYPGQDPGDLGPEDRLDIVSL